MRLLPFLVLALLLLAGCGQKGPLVLPGQSAKASTHHSEMDASTADDAHANNGVTAPLDHADTRQPD